MTGRTPMPDWFKREWRAVVERRTGQRIPLPADVPPREPGEDDPELPDAPPVDEPPPDSLDDWTDDDIPF